jgi:hypothetical protein
MNPDGLSRQLNEGTILEGPHWTQPVRILTAKAHGGRIEVQAVGTHTKRLWKKLLKPEEFDGSIKITQAGKLAALDGNPTHFRLAAEAHRILLAFQYDPHFAVSVSQVDPLPYQMDAVYTHLLTKVPDGRLSVHATPAACLWRTQSAYRGLVAVVVASEMSAPIIKLVAIEIGAIH